MRINQKERKAAIRFLFAEKLRANQVWVIEDSQMEIPKTRSVADFLGKFSIRGPVLFLGECQFVEVPAGEAVQKVSVSSDQHENFIKSVRNLPRTGFLLASNVSGYDLMVARAIVMTEKALQEIQAWLG